ncbi:transcriptional regulator [Castellaniella caeni]|uniref:transcriptional regulator n=1 Tax=Castellaniella caeni TaxID=266123 RepID=UPI000C9FAD09|nr:YdaS family helix-turn-helix protein [Castellaniella caeni]
MNTQRLDRLNRYLKLEKGRTSALARFLEVRNSYLSQMIAGQRPMPADLCVRTEEFTNREVSRIDCRPLDGTLIWPELAQQPAEAGNE